MKNTDFTTTISVEQAPSDVFNAINHVAGWWHGEIIGSADQCGDEFTYRMKEFHFSKQKVTELIPGEKVVWLVTDSSLNFTQDKSEWTGTKIIFEIARLNHKTQVKFTHQGLNPAVECYDDCSNGWTALIQKSLYSLVTIGKGTEVF